MPSYKVWIRHFHYGRVGRWELVEEQPPKGFCSESEAWKWLKSQRVGEACSTLILPAKMSPNLR